MHTSKIAHSGRDRVLSTLETGKVYPVDERSVLLEVEVCSAPPQVAEAFGILRGDPVIRRPRITSLDGVPYSVSTSWFDGVYASAAPRLLQTAPIRQGSFAYLAEMTDRPFSGRMSEEVWAGTAHDEAELLNIEPGSPVLCGRCTIYDDTGRVLEYGEYVIAPERRLRFGFAPVPGR